MREAQETRVFQQYLRQIKNQSDRYAAWQTSKLQLRGKRETTKMYAILGELKAARL